MDAICCIAVSTGNVVDFAVEKEKFAATISVGMSDSVGSKIVWVTLTQ
jgi:hypothetical protein